MLVNIAKALAAFQETIVSGRTPFDDFRDAMARGDRAAMARYPVAARRGLRIFVGKGQCSACHFGPNFTNGEFRNNGFSDEAGRVDGFKAVRASRFNLASAYNDDPAKAHAPRPGAGARRVQSPSHLASPDAHRPVWA